MSFIKLLFHSYHLYDVKKRVIKSGQQYFELFVDLDDIYYGAYLNTGGNCYCLTDLVVQTQYAILRQQGFIVICCVPGCNCGINIIPSISDQKTLEYTNSNEGQVARIVGERIEALITQGINAIDKYGYYNGHEDQKISGFGVWCRDLVFGYVDQLLRTTTRKRVNVHGCESETVRFLYDRDSSMPFNLFGLPNYEEDEFILVDDPNVIKLLPSYYGLTPDQFVIPRPEVFSCFADFCNYYLNSPYLYDDDILERFNLYGLGRYIYELGGNGLYYTRTLLTSGKDSLSDNYYRGYLYVFSLKQLRHNDILVCLNPKIWLLNKYTFVDSSDLIYSYNARQFRSRLVRAYVKEANMFDIDNQDGITVCILCMSNFQNYYRAHEFDYERWGLYIITMPSYEGAVTYGIRYNSKSYYHRDTRQPIYTIQSDKWVDFLINNQFAFDRRMDLFTMWQFAVLVYRYRYAPSVNLRLDMTDKRLYLWVILTNTITERSQTYVLSASILNKTYSTGERVKHRETQTEQHDARFSWFKDNYLKGEFNLIRLHHPYWCLSCDDRGHKRIYRDVSGHMISVFEMSNKYPYNLYGYYQQKLFNLQHGSSGKKGIVSIGEYTVSANDIHEVIRDGSVYYFDSMMDVVWKSIYPEDRSSVKGYIWHQRAEDVAGMYYAIMKMSLDYGLKPYQNDYKYILNKFRRLPYPEGVFSLVVQHDYELDKGTPMIISHDNIISDRVTDLRYNIS